MRPHRFAAAALLLCACTPTSSTPPPPNSANTRPSASASAAPIAAAPTASVAAPPELPEFTSCPWKSTAQGSVHDVDFCSCTHRFVGPLSNCQAEHRIYTTNGGGAHYTTTIRMDVLFADIDHDGKDDALLVVRESDFAPTDKNAREHASLHLVTVRGGELVSLATGAATGPVVSARTTKGVLVLEERGAKGTCEVTYAIGGGEFARMSPPCP